MRNRAVVLQVVLFYAAFTAFGDQNPQNPAAARLNLVVVEGEGVINNVKQRTTRETIVQVEDENHRPVAGAAVVFLLPNDGPGGAFAGGAKTAAMVTDSNGEAVMPRITANQLSGKYQIRVNASYQGRQASITISQANAAAATAAAGSAAAHAGISGKVIGVLIGVAAAGAVGAAVALKGKSSSSSSTPGGTTGAVPAVTGSITGPGNTTIGPPR